MMQLIVERFVAVLQDLCYFRSIRWKMRELDLQIFCVLQTLRKQPHTPALCIMNEHFGKREAQFTFSCFDTVH